MSFNAFEVLCDQQSQICTYFSSEMKMHCSLKIVTTKNLKSLE